MVSEHVGTGQRIQCGEDSLCHQSSVMLRTMACARQAAHTGFEQQAVVPIKESNSLTGPAGWTICGGQHGPLRNLGVLHSVQVSTKAESRKRSFEYVPSRFAYSVAWSAVIGESRLLSACLDSAADDDCWLHWSILAII